MSGDGPSFTEEQDAPMAVRGASVALASGAGCGKTTVLTARYLAYLEGTDRLPLGEIVALTFTDKAARELRQRVRDACRLRLDRGDDPDFWRSTLRGLESARIGTFHGFCGAILRQFPIEAGVEPGFAILEETIAPTVRDEALAACTRRWLATGHDDFRALAVDRGVPVVREALATMLGRRSGRDLGLWLGSSPQDLVSTWEAYRDGAALHPLLRIVQDESAALLRLLADNEPTHPTMMMRRLLLLNTIPGLCESSNPREELARIQEHARVQGGGTAKHWPTEDVYKAVKDLLEKLRKTVGAVLDLLEPDAGRSLKAAEDGLRFARLAVEAEAAYDAAKRADGLLDYDDLLIRARDLVRDGPPRVREAIARSIGVLLVDEFQDTDAIQAEILERLAGDDLAAGRMFLVGDPKQSIYRFRGAQPSIFEAYRGRFPEEGRLNLTTNFRSVPGIIAFVNALFADVFPGAEHALRPGSDDPPTAEPAVEFLWAGAGASAGDRRLSEAQAIASHLARRLDRGWKVRDRGAEATRRATQGDVAILFRSLNDAAVYEQALAAEGLDYHVVGGSAYFAQQEVIDLINVLSTVEDPHDELALAGTLRGPFFGLSDEGLYWLATSPPRDLVAGFERWEAMAELNAADRAALASAHRSLSSWRRKKDHESIAALLVRILDESGFEAALLGEFLGARKRANVRKLVRMARAFDLHGGFTLADFVARLRADLKNPPREEQAATTDEHGPAVRLMTIHQAKGLEFPIVVVPDLDRKRPEMSVTVAVHPDLGPLARPREGDPDDENGEPHSLGWDLYRREEQRAEDEEALRLFYVALTRARDALVLSAGSDPAAGGASPALRLLASRFDRETGACTASLPEGWPAPAARVVETQVLATSGRSSRSWIKPKLLVTAARIERSLGKVAPASEVDPPKPRSLDLDPSAGLAPSECRCDRLVRAALTDPAIFDFDGLNDALDRAARSAPEWPSPRMIGEAHLRLRAWLAGPMARRIAASKEVHRGADWTLLWPLDDPSGTAYRGRIDFVFRNRDDTWSAVVSSHDRASLPRSRLNLLLGAYAADRLGFSPVDVGWVVRSGREADPIRVAEFGAEAVEESIRAVMAEA